MLKRLRKKKAKPSPGRYVVVASRYNARYVDSMVRAAVSELKRAGATNLEVFRVPGAYEIPLAAARLAAASARAISDEPLAAIICLGVILRGETVHAAHIGEAVSWALMEVQLKFEIPVVHEVLLLENENQARVRCLGKTHNRGAEAAQTALEMARMLRKLQDPE